MGHPACVQLFRVFFDVTTPRHDRASIIHGPIFTEICCAAPKATGRQFNPVDIRDSDDSNNWWLDGQEVRDE